MISDSQTWYGSREPCHGRPWRPYAFCQRTTLSERTAPAALTCSDIELAAKQTFELVHHLVLHLTLDLLLVGLNDRLSGARDNRRLDQVIETLVSNVDIAGAAKPQ